MPMILESKHVVQEEQHVVHNYLLVLVGNSHNLNDKKITTINIML